MSDITQHTNDDQALVVVSEFVPQTVAQLPWRHDT